MGKSRLLLRIDVCVGYMCEFLRFLVLCLAVLGGVSASEKMAPVACFQVDEQVLASEQQPLLTA